MTTLDAVDQLKALAREAVDRQADPVARRVLGRALSAGRLVARFRYVDPLELELGRATDTPDGVLAIELNLEGRPVACVEANRVGIYEAGGEMFYCEPPDDQPPGRTWGEP